MNKTSSQIFCMNFFKLMTAGLCFVSFLLTGCNEDKVEQTEKPVKPVKIFLVPSQDESSIRTFPGKVVAGEKVELAFRVSGQLEKFPVKESQLVKAGDVVAELDKSDFITALNNARSLVGGARASLNEAELNLKRMKELLQQDAVSRASFDEASAARDNAKAKMLSLLQDQKQAEQDLEYTTLIAPFDGVVAMTYAKNYEQVQAQQPVLRLENTEQLDIEVEFPEFALSQIRETVYGKWVERAFPVALFSAYPDKTFPLELKEYQTAANAQTLTYTVTFTMENPKTLLLLPGMTAEVQAHFNTGFTDTYSLPLGAVVGSEGEDAFIWVVDKDTMTVSRKPVKIGSIHGDKITIREGLRPAMIVVSAGARYLYEGQKVRFMEGKIGGKK